MIFKTSEYEIIYNSCDNAYIDQLIDYFDDKKYKILRLFEIEKLNKKLIIKLYDTIDKYAEYRNYHLSETSVGNMVEDDNNYYIHMLSYQALIKRKGHENKDLVGLYKLLVHEFVHVCHSDIGDLYNSPIWVREGIAVLLARQYNKKENKPINCTLEDLLINKQVLYSNYYDLMHYALFDCGIDYVKKLLADNEFANEEITKLYDECINVKRK